MTELTSGLDAALKSAAPTIFGAIEIAMPGYTLRLLDGSGTLAFGGQIFVGRDPIYGSLAAVEDLGDGVGDEAPALSITLLPAGDAAAASLAAPTMQGAQVAVWMGAVDPSTGLVIPDPHLLFLGEVDVPTLKAGERSRTLELEVVSVSERFFDVDEGARLVPAFHTSIWPGEFGLDFVTGVAEKVYWGVDRPKSAVVPTGRGFGLPGNYSTARLSGL